MFTSKLSRTNPLPQLSSWLELVRLFTTLAKTETSNIKYTIYSSLASNVFFHDKKFIINSVSGGCRIETSLAINTMADFALKIEKLYIEIEDTFWDMIALYKTLVDEKEFMRVLNCLYCENCVDYIDYPSLCCSSWMAIESNAEWPFNNLGSDEEYPSFKFVFKENRTVNLSGCSIGALHVTNATFNSSTNEIIFREKVLGKVVSLIDDMLTVEMYYYRDINCPNKYFEPGVDTPIQYFVKEDEGRFSEYKCIRIN